ncbi:DUF3037 domain-containing protein [uncultured Flavobacterium sp.]|uniref:DUF3037 domain-containing protein n=1 Tax=uncultured Flavobacterium sp. TaxID=165435 RepID=UPI0030C7E372
MKTNFYTYCILKYKHSPYLDESINIGVLIYFADTKRFSFKYSKNLSRVKCIYDNVPEKTIKEYIRQIDKHLKIHQEVTNNLFPLNDLNLKNFLSSYILPNDGTVLQFSHFKTDLLRGYSEDFIERIILEKVFIDDIKHSVQQQQEPKLLSKFKTNLKEHGLNNFKHNSNRYIEEYVLINETGSEFKFDIAWQNGTLNLVKPVGFDLKEGRGILDKAHKNFGQFYDLEKEAEEKKLRYDLIIGKPKSKDLFRDFDHAIKLLQKVNHVSLIDEDELDAYSIKVIKEISKTIL